MNIFVLDRDLEMQGMVEDYISMQWTRDYLGEGGLELHCYLTKDNLSLLQVGHTVYKSNSDEGAIITHRELTQDDEGNEILVVLGYLLQGLLSMRIVWDDKVYKGTTESVVRQILDNHLITPTNTNRKIDNVILGNNNELGSYQIVPTERDNILELVIDVLGEHGYGLYGSVDIDTKDIIFEVYDGVDRSVNNTDNNTPVIFSQDFDNILEQNFVESKIDYKNAAVVLGEKASSKSYGGAVVSLPQVVGSLGGENKGLDRFEMLIDMSNLEREEQPENEYRNYIESRGRFTLNEFAEVQSFEGAIDLYGNLEYKVDYNLGDIVTCKSNRWDIEIDIRITSILEIYEEDGMRLEITFGNPVPTLMRKIRKVVK